MNPLEIHTTIPCKECQGSHYKVSMIPLNGEIKITQLVWVVETEFCGQTVFDIPRANWVAHEIGLEKDLKEAAEKKIQDMREFETSYEWLQEEI